MTATPILLALARAYRRDAAHATADAAYDIARAAYNVAIAAYYVAYAAAKKEGAT